MIEPELIKSFPVEEYLLTRLAISPDGSEVAVGHKKFRTYDTASGEVKAEFEFEDFLAQLTYSADGRWIAAANVSDNHPGTRGRVTVYEAASGRRLWAAEAPLPVETCSFRAASPAALLWSHTEPVAGGQPRSAVAAAVVEPYAALPQIELADLQVKALAATADGIVCYGREAAGTRQEVEGADLIFRKFRLLSLDAKGGVKQNHDLGIGAGVHALSPDGKLLALELVDFKNNERHVSVIDVETGVEANLLALEANTLPVLEFGAGSEYLLCMKEDAEANFNRLRVWRTSDLKLVGEARVELAFHAMASCMEQNRVALLGGGKLELYGLG